MNRILVIFSIALSGIAAFTCLWRKDSSRAPIAVLTSLDVYANALHVPHARGPIVLDGDMDDPGWLDAIARTGALMDGDGLPARPYSDARLVWRDEHLFVALYAADEDIRSTQADADSPLWLDDAFRLTFGDDGHERAFEVSPTGVLTDALRDHGRFDYAWQSGAHVSHEIDGTLNAPEDDDEEWVIEMAIPLEALGLKGERGERIALSIRRCDTPHHQARVCAAWGDGPGHGSLILD